MSLFLAILPAAITPLPLASRLPPTSNSGKNGNGCHTMPGRIGSHRRTAIASKTGPHASIPALRGLAAAFAPRSTLPSNSRIPAKTATAISHAAYAAYAVYAPAHLFRQKRQYRPPASSTPNLQFRQDRQSSPCHPRGQGPSASRDFRPSAIGRGVCAAEPAPAKPAFRQKRQRPAGPFMARQFLRTAIGRGIHAAESAPSNLQFPAKTAISHACLITTPPYLCACRAPARSIHAAEHPPPNPTFRQKRQPSLAGSSHHPPTLGLGAHLRRKIPASSSVRFRRCESHPALHHLPPPTPTMRSGAV